MQTSLWRFLVMEVKIDNRHLVVSPHSDISVRQMVQINDGETERTKITPETTTTVNIQIIWFQKCPLVISAGAVLQLYLWQKTWVNLFLKLKHGTVWSYKILLGKHLTVCHIFFLFFYFFLLDKASCVTLQCSQCIKNHQWWMK